MRRIDHPVHSGAFHSLPGNPHDVAWTPQDTILPIFASFPCERSTTTTICQYDCPDPRELLS